LEAEIKLSYNDVKEAKAVTDAVSPDNIDVPLGLFVKTERRGSNVFTQISCQTKLKTFLSTIDDLLSCVSIAERSFSIAKGHRSEPEDSNE
jgi:hypothetical protein